MRPTDFVADFDSASAMLRATAAGLERRGFPTLGVKSPMELVAPIVNRLPDMLKEQVYIWGGAMEAVPPESLDELDEQSVARDFVAEYAARPYPAVMVGSSNGAGVHLAVAIDAPFLPQTWLLPVRRDGVHPDEPLDDLEWGRRPGERLLAANPDLQLHHMHDPNQDRLMVQRMTYFRVKRRRLGYAYESFIREHLEPGGTIILVETQVRWPVIRLGERHVFQPGAMGGITPDEYLHGSERVREYLRRYGSHRTSWDFGDPNDEAPEAEWGFEPALREDVERFAAQHGFRVMRLVFEHPEDLSPPVADLYRRWYGDRGTGTSRLLCESFILLEPTLAMRTGSVPYWAKFSTVPSVERLERYLDESGGWREVLVMLFPHGTEGAGFADVDRWREVVDRFGGRFVGVDESAFPRDFAGLKNYHEALADLARRDLHPEPDRPWRLDDVVGFFAERPGDAAPRFLPAGSPTPALGAAGR